MMLIDRFKGELYKYHDVGSSVQMKAYSMNNDSICGFVGKSCTTLFSENVRDEIKYNINIDDPKS